ncbi:RepB family plasmid replication initiator protein [Enterococcus saccharolyticus]|uniref:Replication-associated protein RepB n=4 Tax=Enterococcus TaxID=1350 RepID=A0A0E3MUH9_ENTFL|nr:RepB family plasmid replication initiator protein [Enterococcus saccharolyticus]AKA86791.1 Replication-associated protein RepB [Enterococcus faecalis]AWH58946.1 Replication-associated protein RepB [Enterococcus faecalis]AWH58988.1 Replication-associated protein RepB [Enterococcus faecalis]QHU25737.1 Replication-associated protein RepB [Enterococcus faecalis]
MLNSSISRKVLMMNDIQNKKIVQDNDLIVSVAKMDKTPMKFFELAVASLDIKNIPADRTVHVSKELLYSFFDAKSENKHTRFKDAVLTVHEQAVFLMRELNERKGKYEYQVISPLERTSWNDYEDIVSFKFTESIFPYLIDLKGTYTQYLLSDIAQLNSKYSIIIYKWLSMNYNQYDYYNAKGGRREKQLNEYKNPIIPIEELRRITDTEKEYLKFSNFEARVLKKAVEEINQFTVLNATYEKIKKGNRIGSIQFHITKKQIAPNPSYKIGDSVYEAQQAEKEQNQITLFAQAMQSQYTTILMENMLIGYKDMQDIELMASLQEMVYPLYDELKTLRGLDGVRNHLEYVSRKQIGYSKTNIVKYLKTAITQYLPTVKMMDMDNRV